MLQKILSALAVLVKLACYLMVGLSLGYIVGDEINQRKLRAELRELCYEQALDRHGGDLDKLSSLVAQYQCRNAVP